MCVEGGDCSCKVELRCFKGAKHKFEIDYEYQAGGHVIICNFGVLLSLNYCQEIDKEDVNTDPNQGALDGDQDQGQDHDHDQAPFKGDHPPRPHQPNDPSNKSGHNRSSPKRKKFRCERKLFQNCYLDLGI